MTQLTREHIPASIGTVEQLAVWCSEVLNYLYTTEKAVEAVDADGLPLKVAVCDVNRFYVDVASAPGWRYVNRTSLPLKKDYQLEGKVWSAIGILGDATVPVGMRA